MKSFKKDQKATQNPNLYKLVCLVMDSINLYSVQKPWIMMQYNTVKSPVKMGHFSYKGCG